MTPGRELDALVAERVMGWKIAEHYPYGGSHGGIPNANGTLRGVYIRSVPFYSTDIAAAWGVVEHIFSEGLGGVAVDRYNVEMIHPDYGVWVCCIVMRKDLQPSISINGDTAPHAICLAALKAVE